MIKPIPIPSEAHIPLSSVCTGVAGLRTLIVNLYGVQARDGSWVMIDTGLPYKRRVLEWARAQFGDRRPTAIVLTHGHFDHVGTVEALVNEWNVPVYAHALELPYLTGKSPYPPPDATVGGGAMSLMSPLLPRGPIDLGKHVQMLPADGAVPGLPEWRWVHTPGHAPGHVSFFRESDRTLIAGDAVVTTKQESFVAAALTQRVELQGPPAYFTYDWMASRKSVQALAELRPEVIATGHGIPIGGRRATEALEELANQFITRARPDHGRYVHEPALTDQYGVISVPPAPRGLAGPALMATAAVAGVVWWAASRSQRKSGVT